MSAARPRSSRRCPRRSAPGTGTEWPVATTATLFSSGRRRGPADQSLQNREHETAQPLRKALAPPDEVIDECLTLDHLLAVRTIRGGLRNRLRHSWARALSRRRTHRGCHNSTILFIMSSLCRAQELRTLGAWQLRFSPFRVYYTTGRPMHCRRRLALPRRRSALSRPRSSSRIPTAFCSAPIRSLKRPFVACAVLRSGHDRSKAAVCPARFVSRHFGRFARASRSLPISTSARFSIWRIAPLGQTTAASQSPPPGATWSATVRSSAA